MKKIDIDTWNRKEHFNFYKNFDEPFFGLVADLDCTNLYQACKSGKESFFLKYLHKTLIAINQIHELKCRVVNNEVVEFDAIHVSSTIPRKDNTFAFTFIEYSEDFEQFKKSAKEEIDAVQNSTGLRVTENSERVDTIHFSAIPWVKFTSISHPRHFQYKDTVPKITFGKMIQSNDKKIIPVSIHVHHGLADGYHAGLFFDSLQKLMNIF